jgi:steroid delta-isomerase-like uncharacterized protein
MMSSDERLAIVRRHLEAENAYRLKETLDTLTPDCVFEDMALGERVEGHTGATEYYERWWRAFPDLTWEPQRRWVTDEGLISEVIARGTHRGDFFGLEPTGRPIELPVILVVDFRDGRISGERLYYDLATVLRQLGARAIPPPLR